MRVVRVSRRIDASRTKVWAVLADFPNIADWNRGVNRSYATSDATTGVGAKRHCDLAPVGALEETVTGWDEERRFWRAVIGEHTGRNFTDAFLSTPTRPGPMQTFDTKRLR